jgi:hypothetical protein
MGGFTTVPGRPSIVTPGAILVMRGAHAVAINKIITAKTAGSAVISFVPTIAFLLADSAFYPTSARIFQYIAMAQ